MSEVNRIRVLVVDDHAVLRSGLTVFLATVPDFQLVGEAGNGEEAVALCHKFQPDVILMDLQMPRMNGMNAIRQIRQLYPHIRIVVLTNFVDEKLVQEALTAGAISYLLKHVTGDELAYAIREAYAERGKLAREATQALVNVIQHPPPPAIRLTTREREVLRLLARGMSNRDIAAELVIAVPTVKRHVTSILAKFNTSSRTEALVMAVQQNMLDD
jgi:DNA-binding NarL/FixJ family response regulator